MDQRLEELRESFAKCDISGDGQIQFDEFVTLLHNLGAEMSDQDCRIGFREVDADRNGLINFDEFVTWWTDH